MTRHNSIIVMILLAFCVSTMGHAKKRTEREKLSIASKLIAPQKLYSAEMITVYGDTPGGYVVVSNDDIFEPVLGYSDKPFDSGNMPPGLSWWLTTINETMKQKKAANSLNTVNTVKPSRNVDPLLTTQWDQSPPFNDKCPIVDSWSKAHGATGCVATAMAQIMKYHEYPEQGIGTGSYSIQGKSGAKTMAINTVYDWANMLDRYQGFNISQSAKDAVADLLFDCGLASGMSYAAQGSGTTSMNATRGLTYNMQYDSLALRCYFRAFFNDDRWMSTIYQEIEAGRPVLLSANDDKIGMAHAFVLDGVRADNGYVHVNWGWSGDADGYYDLFNLNPKTAMQTAYGQQGYDFSHHAIGQSVIIGIVPPAAGVGKEYESFFGMADEENFSISGNQLKISIPNIINYHYQTFYGILGFVIEDVKTEKGTIWPFYYVGHWQSDVPVNPLEGWNNWEFNYSNEATDNLADGEYLVYLVSWHQSEIGKTNPRFIRFVDKGDGNENYNIWKLVKSNGKLQSISKQTVSTGIKIEESGWRNDDGMAWKEGLGSSSELNRQNSTVFYDLQGRKLSEGRMPKGFTIMKKNGKSYKMLLH